MSIADLFSLTSLSLGMLSIFFSYQQNFKVAAILIPIAVLFDFFDGKVARMLKRKGDFGKHIDSLCDIVSFGVAPAFFTFSQIEPSILNYILILFFVCCGALRLARFNTTNINHFEGMPITWNGILFPLLFFAGLNITYFPYIQLIAGMLMISTIKINKVK